MHHIAAQIDKLGVPQPAVLELCCGAGLLAETLLPALPTARYVGIDVNPPFLDTARARLEPWQERVTLLCADLNGETWPQELADAGAPARFDAVVSLQSLHDLGGEPEVARMYAMAQSVLRPGGLFLNADLIVAPGQELPDNPGRRSVVRHLALLNDCGYTNTAFTLEVGDFGVVVGFSPET
jgi:SAM-dependent methyltransferase